VTRSARMALFGAGGAGLACLFVWAIAGMPSFGANASAYGRFVVNQASSARHVSEAVGVVTLDVRGIDTLGEELILLTAVAAVAVVARRQQQEDEQQQNDEGGNEGFRPLAPSESVRFFGVVFLAVTLLVGLAIVAHGHVTPGGGFQGGVVIASALLLVYLTASLDAFSSTVPSPMLEPAEAIGAGTYLAMGIVGMIISGAYLANVLPFGTSSSIASGGMLVVLNTGIAIEVSAGILLALDDYLRQALVVRPRGAQERS
jgi:multicomponent Na+:H+ antiporter subunit B